MSSTGPLGERPLTVMCVAGARPNFPKVKPVLDSLDARAVRTILVHTGQHYDPSMSDVFFDELGIRSPDHSFDVGSGSHGEQTARILVAFEALVAATTPDMVLVVGDVNSTMACALVAAKAGCVVAHVEAGLRSRDWSMPEEINRVVTDRVSDLLFATSPDAVQNLLDEGYRTDQIHLVGNVMIDSLLANLDRAVARLPRLRRELDLPGRFALATLHRPSNVDGAGVLSRMMGALAEVARGLPVLLPAHPRARVDLQRAAADLGADVRVIDPLGYLDFVALQSAATFVLTDSGGVQEETTALGVPCLTLRNNTERPITVTEGTNQLVGTDPNRIVAAARAVLADGVTPRRPAIWDGHAADRIADVIVEYGRGADRRRPTDR